MTAPATRSFRPYLLSDLRPYAVWPHHLVVLVLYDVAMPDIQAGEVEQCFDPGDLTRIGDDGVLVARLPSLRRSSTAAANCLPVDYLELDLVDVDGVSVLGEGEHLHYLGGVDV